MESKYKERAEKLLEDLIYIVYAEDIVLNKEDAIEAMCQLAEEVENIKLYNSIILSKEDIKNRIQIEVSDRPDSNINKRGMLLVYESLLSQIEHNHIVESEETVFKPTLYTREQVEELFVKQKGLLLNNTLEFVSAVDYSVRSNYTVTEAIYDAFEDTNLKLIEMGDIEIDKCDFCQETKPVERTYLKPSKYIKNKDLQKINKLHNQGDYFIIIKTCNSCGKPRQD